MLETDPLLKNVIITYYDDGTLWKITDRNNKTTTFTHTPSGKTDTVTYQGGATVSYTYDQNDFPTKMQDSIGATIYAPDAVNRLASSTDPRNFTISYNNRDANGNVTQITYPGNKTVSYTYDALNRVKTVTIDWLNKTATYIYDDAGRMTDLTQFNNTIAHYAYDNANRLTGLENRLSTGGSAISSYSYTLDGNGNRTAINQIVPVGINVTPGSRDFTMNIKKDRLQQAGSTSFTYDDEGQLATKAGDIYQFDDAHRVVSITGSVNHTYRYDGTGNRLEATRNGVVTRYIYDANGNLLAEADGNNVIQKYYIYGNGLLGMVTSGGSLYSYHFDGTGHTVALTDASANVVNKYAYTPFGVVANQQEAVGQPFKYAGQYGVMTEPNGLYYMKARYYDSSVGRFISEDPLGFGGGDVNLMAYTSNNPVNRIDPLGLWYIDVNLTFGVGNGFSAGLQVGPSGAYLYGGVGPADGAGVSVTANTGNPSPGGNLTVTASGGNGIVGGLVSGSHNSGDPSVAAGVGWGLGFGGAATVNYTLPIWQPKNTFK